MATCFIFAKYLRPETCLSLRLNPLGEVESPLEARSFAEIRELQTNATTMVILPTEHFSLFHVELSWLPEKKARLALPFALEDQLAENVEELHFAFDRKHYQQGQYLVVVAKKSFLRAISETLDSHGIKIDNLTLDWFALADHEACLTDSSLLVNDKTFFCGALAPELRSLYLKQIEINNSLYTFTDSQALIQTESSEALKLDSSVWIAQRLHKNKFINLNQGEFQQSSNYVKTKRWYFAALVMGLLWLSSFILINSFKLHQLNTKIDEVDSQIARIYHEFFPEAKQIINPRVRITQMLKSRKNDNESVFWVLLQQLSLATQNKGGVVEQLRFQNQMLQVTLINKGFATLESLQNFLKQASIRVKQTQASSRDGQVIGTLELSI